MSFFESLGDSVVEGFADASPWNFVSNKAHQGAFYYYYYLLSVYTPTCILCLLLAPQKFLLKNFRPNIIVFSICLLTFWMIPGRKS